MSALDRKHALLRRLVARLGGPTRAATEAKVPRRTVERWLAGQRSLTQPAALLRLAKSGAATPEKQLRLAERLAGMR